MQAVRKIKDAIIVAYIPVLHEGYRCFFDKYPNAKTLLLLGKAITKDYVPIEKDIRALDPRIIKKSLDAWKRFKRIDIVDIQDLGKIEGEVVMPDDEFNRELKEKYLKNVTVRFDSIFLRWDKHSSSKGVPVDVKQVISNEAKDVEIINLLNKESEKSSDFWRSVGAGIVKSGKLILLRHNSAVPSEMMPYVEGDPRSDFHKGVNIELATSLHAEAGLIADAARQGISLEGSELFVTTFPCPPCAKLIAYSGIKKVYYAGGYGVLDAERILKSRGIEIIFVEVK
jgi:dCMP deaminase